MDDLKSADLAEIGVSDVDQFANTIGVAIALTSFVSICQLALAATIG